MRRLGIFAVIVALCGGVEASWYWPVGSNSVDEKPKRVSELIEPASLLIDEASDLAAEGKTSEAVEKYRKALAELDRIEMENPDRAKSLEFATIRNKRAYVNAAIDAMLLNQVQENAKAVAVSDTTELEKRLDRERWGKRVDKAKESFDRQDTEAALAEIEKAMAGTTNIVLIGMASGVSAAIHCQKGAFENARQALKRSRQALAQAGKMTDEERELSAEILKSVRLYVVDGHAKAIAAGRRACAGCDSLETADLTTTNAVATANEVVESLGALQAPLTAFAFKSARNLSRASTNLQQRVTKLLRDLESGEEKPVWNIDTVGFESALEAFAAVSSEIRRVDASLSAAQKTVGDEKKDKEAKDEEGKRETSAKAEEAKKENGDEKAEVTPQPEEVPAPAPAEAPKPSVPAAAEQPAQAVQPTEPAQTDEPAQTSPSAQQVNRREQVMTALAKNDWATAERLIAEWLVEKPNAAVALNLKAAMESRQGKLKEAEATLDQAIMTNPRSYYAYYNMAKLMLQVRSENLSIAKRYYETGRRFGGPVDVRLEEALK